MRLVRIIPGWDAPGPSVGDFLHLPGVISTANTLCGWCDAPHESVDAPAATCPECCDIVRRVRKIPLSALGAPAKIVKVSRANLPPTTEADLQRLRAAMDGPIDASDIPISRPGSGKKKRR